MICFSKKKIVSEYLLSIFFINCFLFNTFNWKISGIESLYDVNFYLGFILMFCLILTRFIVNPGIHHKTKIFMFFLIGISFLNVSTYFFWADCEKYFLKMLISLPIYVLLLVLGFDISIKSSQKAWQKLPLVSLILLIFFLLTCLIELLFPTVWPDKQSYREAGLLSGILGEPSFLGWASVTLLGVTFFGHKWVRSLGFILWGVFAVISPSGTFVMLSFSLMFYLYFLRRGKLLIGSCFLAVLILLIYFDVKFVGLISTISEYYYQRILTVILAIEPNIVDATNISYYAQGIHDALFSFTHTFGLGSGHNRMGCFDRASTVFLENMDYEKDITTGSFLMAKIIYEWGVIGVLSLLYLWRLTLKSSQLNLEDKARNISTVVLFMTLMTFVVRSNLYTDHLYFVIALPVLLATLPQNSKESG